MVNYVVLASLGLTLTPGLLSALVVNFNTSGQLEAGFSTAASSNLISQSANGGLGGSGSLSVPGGADNQIWASVDAFAGNSDNSFSFYFKTPSTFGDVGYVSFGAMADAATGTSTGLSPSSGNYLGGYILPSSGTFELRGEGAFNNSGGSLTSSMVADSWYYVNLTYDWQFNEFYSLSLEVNASDSSGNIGASLVSGSSFSAGLESSIAGDSSVYLYFGGGSSLDNAVTSFDNLSSPVLVSAVPEPGHMGFLAGLGLSLALFRRRYRSV